ADISERVARLREAAAIHRDELHDPRAAAAVLRIARAATPDDEALLKELVAMLSDAKDFAEAIEELRGAIERLAPGDAGPAALRAQRAALRDAIDDHAGALADLEQAFAIDEAAHAHALAEQLERASAAAARAGDAARERTDKLRLAQILERLGDFDGARARL